MPEAHPGAASNAAIGAAAHLPRLPVAGPHNQTGPRSAALPGLLDAADTLLTTSGRAAILLGLQALELPAGALVLVPSYHCPTMVSPVLALGLRVGFYPLGSEGAPNLDWLGKNAPEATRVICVTHLFGLPLDLADMQAWCQERQVFLLEDCAHALFGRSASGIVGSHGDVAIASLPKFLPAMEGGVLRLRAGLHAAPLARRGIVAELKTALDLIETSAGHGMLGRWSSWAGPLIQLKQRLRPPQRPNTELAEATEATEPRAHGAKTVDLSSEHARIDRSLAMKQPTAVTLKASLGAHRGRVVARRRANYQRMSTAFAGRQGLRPLQPVLPADCAPYVFPLWVDAPDPAYQQLRAAHVPLSRWDWLWPGVPAMAGDCGPTWAHHVLQLPCHQDLDDTQCDALIEALLQSYAH